MKQTSVNSVKHRKTALERERFRSGFLMLIPAFVLCFVFILIPLFNVFKYSFSNWDGLTVDQQTGKAIYDNVGLYNYKNLPNIDGFGEMMVGTFLFAIGTTALTIVISFMVALILDKGKRKCLPRSLMRALWFLPALLSGAVVGILWRVMYNNGVINKILGYMNLPSVNWLETRGLTNFAVIVGATWVQIGFCVVIFLAGLQSIPTDLYEAAAIDGASPRQNLWSITFPLMAPSITINVITTTIAGFKAYELPYLISMGLPGKSTLLLSQRISFYGFESTDYGRGSALSVMLLAIIVLISLIQLIYLRRRENIFE